MSRDDGAAGVAAASGTVAAWTLVSRATGFVRVAVVAAVLGATYLGNTYGATNYIPNLTLELVSGSVLGSLLVPPLVRALDRSGRGAAQGLAGAYLGLVLVALTGVAVIAAAAAPLLIRLLAAGVTDRDVAGDQAHVGWILLTLQVWQIPLYGIVQVATAAQTARGRFALAAGAPIVENVGIIAVMGAYSAIFGLHPVDDVSGGQMLLLGGGSTAAVACHALLQWWGAYRGGLTLRPRLGWKEPEVRDLMRDARMTLRLTILTSTRTFGALIVANTVAGGVLAFQVGLNFLWLPGALGARPVAVALQPVLARLHHREAFERFREEFVRGLSVVVFFAVPATVLYVVLADPIAHLVANGQFRTSHGLALVTATLAGLGAGVIADSTYVLALYASFAKDDVRSPYRAMALAALVGAAGMAFAAIAFDGRDTLLALGLAYSLSTFVAGWRLAHRVVARVVRSGVDRAALRALAASAAMIGPAYLIAITLPGSHAGRASQAAALVVATLVGGAIYVGLQRAWGSPELSFFAQAILRRGPPEET